MMIICAAVLAIFAYPGTQWLPGNPAVLLE